MREIKFRVFSTPSKRMIYLKFGEYNSLDDLEGSDTWVVMQYTGLKDKNGKEIYEGDILINNGVNKSKRDRYIVKFIFGNFVPCRYLDDYESMTPYSDKDELGWAPFQYPGISLNLEVIGNIYENPEPLEDNNAKTNIRI